MSLSLTLLGTSASRPTVERNVSSIAVAREGETLLFDCGEGTQRQMMRYGVSFALDDIFFTHFHADHMGARVVIEIGTFVGLSTTALASGPTVEAVYTCDASNDCLPFLTTADGTLLYQHPTDEPRVLVAPWVAAQMTDLLERVGTIHDDHVPAGS